MPAEAIVAIPDAELWEVARISSWRNATSGETLEGDEIDLDVDHLVPLANAQTGCLYIDSRNCQ